MLDAGTCRACPLRLKCTTAGAGKRGRALTLREPAQRAALQQRRREQETDAWRERYRPRAGIEATVCQIVHRTHARRSRYRTAATHLGHCLAAGRRPGRSEIVHDRSADHGEKAMPALLQGSKASNGNLTTLYVTNSAKRVNIDQTNRGSGGGGACCLSGSSRKELDGAGAVLTSDHATGWRLPIRRSCRKPEPGPASQHGSAGADSSAADRLSPMNTP
ncbi:transposase [Streptomyces sp. NPDC001698]|uniref:transposase n=1 Tax=unclassified Streptomyces TaxID=2593676 RepID=UPI0036BE2720